MSNAVEVMNKVVELMRGLTQAKRSENLQLAREIAEGLGLNPADYDFLKLNVSKWPTSLSRDSTEIRYGVDFGYGDQPDHRLYGATFDEVAKLLRYTPQSCRVSFNTAKNNKIDRTGRRQTRLGPCVVTKLAEVVDPADYPTMRRLSDKELEMFPPAKVVGGKPVRWRGNKY